MTLVRAAVVEVGVVAACLSLGVSRASYYRWLHPAMGPHRRRHSRRALAPSERARVLETLHSERFVDCSPGQVVATLMDERTYLCSERTMYRLLAQHAEIRERRDQRRHPVYARPELLADKPNVLWSWDITKLRGPAKWSYFYLYVILDVFSRYVVGWMIAEAESAELAQELIAQTCRRQNIARNQLTIHADRGSSMTSKPVAFLLADLGVTKTHSRPHVSNDNPFSEAQFKTLKYMPAFPDKFGSLQHARDFGRTFFAFYNTEHRHSGIAMMTPHQVHHGLDAAARSVRQDVLDRARLSHPERFVHGRSVVPEVPKAVWINPPQAQSPACPPSGDSPLGLPVS